MKNTQLRIGNKVLHNGIIKTVDLISPGYVAFLEDRPNDNNFGDWTDLDEVEFIELTEEILFKCGFKYLGNGFYESSCLNISIFSLSGIKINIGFKGVIIGEIKHLHQLQNIIYFLTNKELEINL